MKAENCRSYVVEYQARYNKHAEWQKISVVGVTRLLLFPDMQIRRRKVYFGDWEPYTEPDIKKG